MGGGIAIFLALVVIVVLGVIGLVLYLTGGLLTLRKPEPVGDEQDRPRYKEVTSPELEHTNFGSRTED
jgi:hypothetical protein